MSAGLPHITSVEVVTVTDRILHGLYDQRLDVLELVTDESLRTAGGDTWVMLRARRVLRTAALLLGEAGLYMVLIGDGLLVLAEDAGVALDVLDDAGWDVELHAAPWLEA